ncbi:two-component regulator propeller domain-containing protein [Fulvivirga ligni]|uniref:two-component regulator propeller domain-containing protein n=1 Tax=Fulvivirga ligni TaxID=2904246 RepID=UPI001F17517D|nr:two-component regulator propeller domain-containing protein [Fulvivirga ligni]UII19263.1 response regulator [Fulvivirga ligni]
MNRTLLLLCIYFILFYHQNALAQPSELLNKDIIFHQPHENLGLSQRSINCMIEDKRGYLWIGTWEGLMLYDGYSTTIFQSENDNDNSLKSNKITSLFEDSKGNIWVGTMMGGLYAYDPINKKFTHFQHDPSNHNSISDNNIWSIVEADNGDIWVGTQNGLNRLHRKQNIFTKYFHSRDPKSLSYNFITSLMIDGNNNLWIATEKGVNKLALNDVEGGFTKYFYESESERAIHNYCYKIASFKKDGKDVICWSTKRGLKILDGTELTNYLYPNASQRFSFFRTLYTYNDSDDYIILGSEAGLSMFDPKTRTFKKFFGDYSERVNLSHNTVTSIFIDNTGVLWVGTKKGINKFDTYNKNFELYATSTFDDTRGIITGIQGAGSDQKYWISTMGGGLYLFDRANHTNVSSLKDLFTPIKIGEGGKSDLTDFIQTMATDSNDDLWIGTAGDGVYKLVYKQGIVQSLDHYNTATTNKLSDDYIMSFDTDGEGNMWIGTWSGGLNKISEDGSVQVFADSVLSIAPLVSLYSDGQVLWVGTRGSGLLKIQYSQAALKVERYTQANSGLNNDFINDIYEDTQGRLWIGSEGGLNEFIRTENSIRSYALGREDNSVVVGILESKKGELWLSNWNGIAVVNPDDSLGVLHNYDVQDRVQGGFFYSGVCYRDQAGRLLFGGNNGLNVLKPEAINENPVAPRVVITDFRIYNQAVLPNETFNGRVVLTQPVSEADEIDLDYYENAISFEFSALHFAAPEKNQYAYRLLGYDSDWKYTSAQRRFVNYTNLRHGNYTFEVKASNNDGVWSEEVQTIHIHISPPWWKTIWAVIAYFLISSAVLLLFRHMIIIRTNYLNDIKMERLERENILKMNQSKLKFFTNISHEFRTPLTLIIGPLEKLIASGLGGKYVRDELDVINKNAQRLLRLVNQLLDFRKAESGKLQLKVAEGNIVRFTKEIKLMFEGLAEKLGVSFVFYTNTEDARIWYDRDQFEKVLFNLLSNAFKHVNQGGEVKVGVEEYENKVRILVEDNGSGISSEKIHKIFDRFYSDGDDKSGTGIGLSLSKTLVKKHHGEIEVQSTPGESTVFIVTLKKGKEHFEPKELIDDFKDSEYIGHYQSITELETDLIPQGMAPVGEEPEVKAELKKLLIAEDNEEVRSYVRSMFADKYQVIEAKNGKEALKLAEKEMPDIVVSDVMMPEMDGIALCKTLKRDTNTSHIPIILLTARTSLIYKVEGLESGADDYITKPFNYQVLALKVKNLVATREHIKKHFNDNQTLNIEPKKVTFSSADEIFIEKALESVENNMSNYSYSVEDFGEDVGMSRMQIYRKLKALTGQSANEFIRTMRLKRAAQLLETNDFTVAEVTYQVGFQDLQYFRSCFKKYFGINPSEYGKKQSEVEESEEEI